MQMSEEAKSLIRDNLTAVSRLVEAYPHYAPVGEVPGLLHMKPEALRASMEQGRCPFGFCWKLGERFSYKISTVALCSWLLGQPAIP